MSLHRACCCDAGCITDCCDFWSCSPSTQKTMTLSGSWSAVRHCDDGTTRTEAQGTWTLTAVLTRIGSSCSTYRYIATTAQYQCDVKVTHWTHQLGSICGAPPGPCGDWTYCVEIEGSCSCGTVQWAKCTEDRYQFSTTLTGQPAAYNGVPDDLKPVRTAQAVITIGCIDDPCRPGCKAPVLIFTPADQTENQGCAPFGSMTGTVSSYPMSSVQCCDQQGSSTDAYTACLNPWAIIGDGCLDAATFDNARTTQFVDFGPQCTWFSLWNPAYQYVYNCGGWASCAPVNFTTKLADDCWDWTTLAGQGCYRFDPEFPNDYNKVIFVCWPSPQVLCCSMRGENAISWNLV